MHTHASTSVEKRYIQKLLSEFDIEHTTIQLDEGDCAQGEQNCGGARAA